MSDQNNMTKIYVLICPKSHLVRYVGKTCRSIDQRLKEHILMAKNGCKSFRSRWIRKLLKENLYPIINIIETCKNKDWIWKEMFWINFYKNSTNILTNLTNGGEGSNNYKSTPERNKKCSLSAIKRWSCIKEREKAREKTLKFLENPENRKIYGLKSKNPSEKTRKLISEGAKKNADPTRMSLQAKKQWVDHREKLLEARKKLYTQEFKKKISETLKRKHIEDEEYRKKFMEIQKTKKKRSKESYIKQAEAMRSKKRSPEICAIMKAAAIKREAKKREKNAK